MEWDTFPVHGKLFTICLDKGSTFNFHAQDPALIGCSFRGLNEYPFLSTNP